MFEVFLGSFNEFLQMSSCLGIHLAYKKHFGSISTIIILAFPHSAPALTITKNKQTMKHHQQKCISWSLTHFFCKYVNIVKLKNAQHKAICQMQSALLIGVGI